MSESRAVLIERARSLIEGRSTDVKALKTVADQLYRRSDAMPLHSRAAIDAHGGLRDLADKLYARADALEGS
jgi:hypothetical protein